MPLWLGSALASLPDLMEIVHNFKHYGYPTWKSFCLEYSMPCADCHMKGRKWHMSSSVLDFSYGKCTMVEAACLFFWFIYQSNGPILSSPPKTLVQSCQKGAPRIQLNQETLEERRFKSLAPPPINLLLCSGFPQPWASFLAGTRQRKGRWKKMEYGPAQDPPLPIERVKIRNWHIIG